MSKVLVVDDEKGYREKLEHMLSAEGYEVKTASNGREAIELGSCFRPDVVVTDWMLKDHVHGLRVSEALRAVRPGTSTILITGYASPDLRTEAESNHRVTFIEKPFSPTEILAAVRQATMSPRPEENLMAVVEIEEDGTIVYANPTARQLFKETTAGEDAQKLNEILGRPLNLEVAAQRWLEFLPPAPRLVTWRVRSKSLEDGRSLVVLLGADEIQFMGNHAVVQLLLDVVDPGYSRWPSEGRILVLDRENMVRRLVLTVFDWLGCTCHVASNDESALELFERDTGIDTVIVDFETSEDVAALVQNLRSLRPDIKIVGNSTTDREEDFASLGVELFLLKPWRSDELINLLTGRLGSCKHCGVQLPLRKPKEGETAGRWECKGCGMNYTAVLDRNFPTSVQSSVRKIPPPKDTPRA